MTSTQKRKTKNVEVFGGACQLCGYSRCKRALQFHHKDSSEKDLWSKSGRTSAAEIEAHPERFMLLCANCHFEEHDRLDEATRTFADCLHCGKQFQTKTCLLDAGKGKYCGRACQKRHWSDTAPDRIADRFWEKVDKSGECWLWTGYISHGLGYFHIKSPDGSHRPQTAHRTSWILHFGPVPKGSEIIRTCRNRVCVRPDHLAIGDRKRMGANREALGLAANQEKIATLELGPERVEEIRRRYEAGGISQAALGAEYGLKQYTISKIVGRRGWAELV